MVYIPDPVNQGKAREVRYCTRCFTPNTRPRITFDDAGVCNACNHTLHKYQNIDWESRRREFQDILERHRSRDGSWDCVVPWSGGKDSSTIAYRLKYEYGMNPLLVTFSPMLPNEVGSHNREALIQAGFDHLFFRPNQKVHRHLARRFFIERGNPKVAWDAGINAIPLQAALHHGIRLVIYAEHGETEYGGKVLKPESAKVRDFTEVIEHQIGDDPRNWLDEAVGPQDLGPYLYPDPQDLRRLGVTAYYFSYFHRWSMYENYLFIREKIPFRTHPAGRTTGTITDFDSLDDKMDPLYYYMQYIKFGFGRAVRDGSRLIQNHCFTREELLPQVRRWDGEFPNEFLDEVLAYLDMDRAEFTTVVDRHRNPEIWLRRGQDWVLRHPLPEN